MPSKLQLQLGTHRRRCVTSVESSMRKCCLRPSAVLEHFWASTPISFSFRCPWDFSTSTLRQHFCFSAGKRQQKNMEKPKQSTHRDLSSQGTLSMKTALGEDTTRQSNVQVLWDDMMIDVGIFGSYLIDSERKFMGFGSSNPHIALGFTQFLTVWYIYMFDTDSNMLRDAPWSNWRGPPWSRCQQKLRRGFSDSPFEQVCNGLHMHESHADTTSSHMFREHAHKLDLRSWHQWPLDGPHV